MVILLAASLLVPALAAQVPGGTAVIRGRVIAGDTGEPIAGAIVLVVSSGTVGPNRSLAFGASTGHPTDDQGAFLIQGLRAGTCFLRAIPPPDKRMYLQSGSVHGPPLVFELTEGHVLELDIALPRAGAISGRAVDAYGRPMAGVSIAVLASGPGRRLSRLALAFTTPVTDDYGRYRAWGLPSGTYFVRAEPDERPQSPAADPDGERFVRTYFPGVTSFSAASAVTLRTSEEATNVDIRVERSRTFRLAGRVVDTAGRPVPNANVTLDFADERTTQSGQRDLADGDGRFAFTQLVPADYVLGVKSYRGAPGDPKTSRPVTVTLAGGDVTDLRLTLDAGVTLTGEIVTEVGAPPPFDSAGIKLTALAVEDLSRPYALAGSATIHDDWRFDINDILAPVVIRLHGLPTGWCVRTVTYRGDDILDVPRDFYAEHDVGTIRIVVTGRAGTIKGVVEDAAGRPAPMRPVWLLRDRGVLPAPWFSGSTMALSDERGTFDLPSVPPGGYFLLAADTRPTAPPDDERLAELLKLATQITLGADERKEIRLRLVAWPY